MHLEFTKADLPSDARALAAFDRKVFPVSDCFPPSLWRTYESYWLLLDGVRAGCCAFDRHADGSENFDAAHPSSPGTLYIVSTAILPKYQGIGLGQLFKAWQIAFAGQNGFARIVTNSRKKNRAMISLNAKFGFKIVRTVPRYYAHPTDAAVFMELDLKAPRRGAS